jgi:hypothetical protein
MTVITPDIASGENPPRLLPTFQGLLRIQTQEGHRYRRSSLRKGDYTAKWLACISVSALATMLHSRNAPAPYGVCQDRFTGDSSL